MPLLLPHHGLLVILRGGEEGHRLAQTQAALCAGAQLGLRCSLERNREQEPFKGSAVGITLEPFKGSAVGVTLEPIKGSAV